MIHSSLIIFLPRILGTLNDFGELFWIQPRCQAVNHVTHTQAKTPNPKLIPRLAIGILRLGNSQQGISNLTARRGSCTPKHISKLSKILISTHQHQQMTLTNRKLRYLLAPLRSRRQVGAIPRIASWSRSAQKRSYCSRAKTWSPGKRIPIPKSSPRADCQIF